MEIRLDFLTIQVILAFILAMSRVLAMMMTGPILSRSEIPQMLKIGFAAVFTFLIYPQISLSGIHVIPSEGFALTLLIFQEILIGASIGFFANLLFDLVLTFGHVAGIQMGESAAGIFDPSTRSVANPVAMIYMITSLVIFLILNGFYNLLQVLLKSFELFPIMFQGIDIGYFAENMLPVFNEIFVIALKLILPLLIAMLVADIFVALVARIMPQSNMFFLIMPNKAILGMIVIALSLGGLAANLEDYFYETLPDFYSGLFL